MVYIGHRPRVQRETGFVFKIVQRTPLEEDCMPYVSIRVAGTLTREQKAQIASEVTETIHRVANKPKENIMIMIDELSRENIAKEGKLLDGK